MLLHILDLNLVAIATYIVTQCLYNVFFFTVSSVAVDQILTEHDIAKLMGLLHNFGDKWNEIGLVLGFTEPELKQISSNPLLLISAPASFLTKLLSQWVQWPTVDHPTKPTLGELCETLRSSLIGLGSLAEKVEREMKCSTIGKGSFVLQIARCADVIFQCLLAYT